MMWQAPPVEFVPRDHRLVFVSGLSDPTSCALTQEQQHLLRQLPVSPDDVVPWNFPFLPGPQTVARPVGLLAASRANGAQFLALRRTRQQAAVAAHWQRLFAATTRVTVITLSCGLEIVRQGLACREPEVGTQVRVVALGPVAWRRPSWPCVLIRGARDWVSRLFIHRADYTIADLDHLGYTTHPQVRALLCELLASNTSRS